MQYRDEFNLETLPLGISKFYLNIISDAFGNPIAIPVIVAKGTPGKVIGITAAVHGNELNGIPVIHNIIKNLNLETLKGTIIAVPVVNVSGFHAKQRRFNNTDPNRNFPGDDSGRCSQVYFSTFFKHIIKKLDYLVDLHTAGSGRTTAHYARVDLDDPTIKEMALLSNCQLLLHNKGEDGTLRKSAQEIGVKAITIELCSPQQFQKEIINRAYIGTTNILKHFNFIPGKIITSTPIICKDAVRVLTSHGGILEVYPEILSKVEKGDLVARVKNIFGTTIEEIIAPKTGTIFAKITNPVNKTGAFVLSIGILNTP